MEDLVGYWEKLQAEAAECALIGDRATDRTMRELFARLAEQLDALASELARAITAQAKKDQSEPGNQTS